MSNKLRWGILGVAKINQRLVPAFQQSKTAELIGIASRDAEKVTKAAAEYKIPKAFTSYDALLADPDIDAVYNPLPNTLHDEWTRKAADAGKHILCEKPLTPTAAEAISLVNYCRSKGVRLMDGFMWPHHPRTAKIRKMIDDGMIGPVLRVTGAFTFKLDLDRQNIRLQPTMAGGSLLDVGCYPVYGIRWAFGAEPVKVFASAQYVNDVDVEMNAILWFADGRMATFDCGFTAPLRGWLEIAGTKGVIAVSDMWQPAHEATFELTLNETSAQIIATPGANQIVCMLDDFASAVRENREPMTSPKEAIRNAKVIDALLLSAKEKRIVNVE